jgi:mRNA interferase RelE/StbE
MESRVIIQWTETARDGLKKLPKKVRRGILEKADELCECDPEDVHKALTGPLQGYYRLTCGRYRAIYTVDREDIATGEVLFRIRVLFVAVGIRKEGDKKDVYKLAQKLIRLGLLRTQPTEEEEEDEETEDR